jgi:hypothetical protein
MDHSRSFRSQLDSANRAFSQAKLAADTAVRNNFGGFKTL